MDNNSGIRLQELAVGAGQGLIGAIGGRVVSLIGNILAARFLGPAVFGLYAIGWTLLRFFSLIAPLGLDKGVIRYSSKYIGKDDSTFKGLLLQAFGISLLSGLVLGIVLNIIAPWLAQNVYHNQDLVKVFRYFSFAFPPMILITVIAAATRSTQRVGYSVLIRDLGQPLLGLVLMVVFYYSGLWLIGIILSDIISFIVAVIIGLMVLLHLFPKVFSRDVKPTYPGKELVTFSLPASFATAFVVYIFWVDRLLVGYFRTPFENGIYQTASQVSTLFSVILAGINLVVIPIFADAFHRNENDTIQNVYTIATKWGIYISLPALVVLLVSPNEVLSFLFGVEYSSGARVLVILLFGQLLNLLTGSVNPLIVMSGNQNFLFRLSGIIILIDFLLSLYMIPRIGLYGAAVSTTISLGGLFVFALLWVKKNLGFWPYDKRYIKGFIAAALAWFAVVLVKKLFNLPELELILQGTTAIVVFVITLLVQKLENEDVIFVQKIIRKLVS